MSPADNPLSQAYPKRDHDEERLWPATTAALSVASATSARAAAVRQPHRRRHRHRRAWLLPGLIALFSALLMLTMAWAGRERMRGEVTARGALPAADRAVGAGTPPRGE
jgi:hypothetical protein